MARQTEARVRLLFREVGGSEKVRLGVGHAVSLVVEVEEDVHELVPVVSVKHPLGEADQHVCSFLVLLVELLQDVLVELGSFEHLDEVLGVFFEVVAQELFVGDLRHVDERERVHLRAQTHEVVELHERVSPTPNVLGAC